jgi:hypothetical protein
MVISVHINVINASNACEKVGHILLALPAYYAVIPKQDMSERRHIAKLLRRKSKGLLYIFSLLSLFKKIQVYLRDHNTVSASVFGHLSIFE